MVEWEEDQKFGRENLLWDTQMQNDIGENLQRSAVCAKALSGYFSLFWRCSPLRAVNTWHDAFEEGLGGKFDFKAFLTWKQFRCTKPILVKLVLYVCWSPTVFRTYYFHNLTHLWVTQDIQADKNDLILATGNCEKCLYMSLGCKMKLKVISFKIMETIILFYWQ